MRILVTGGASGLGASIVKLLARQPDYIVFFTYASSAAAARELETTYSNVKGVHCDFGDEASLETLYGQLPDMDIDVLVNNANGSMHKEHFYKADTYVFLNSFRHNIMPVLSITQQAMKLFRKRKFGKIINIISSAVINKPPVGWSEYVANKAYLLAMSKSWATEGIRYNITSNSISPSFMQTHLTADTDERVVEQMQQDHPLKKILTTDEVADAVLFFTKASQQVNGTNLVINAGSELA